MSDVGQFYHTEVGTPKVVYDQGVDPAGEYDRARLAFGQLKEVASVAGSSYEDVTQLERQGQVIAWHINLSGPHCRVVFFAVPELKETAQEIELTGAISDHVPSEAWDRLDSQHIGKTHNI